MDSILTSIKKMLGISEEYEHFDTDITMHINSVFMVLNQIGVGPSKGFRIKDKNSTWNDFIGDSIMLEAVKDYIYLRVKLVFDSTTLSGATIESIKQTIAELEWRLNTAADVGLGSNQPLDYNDLINTPTINGEPLKGNYDEKDPTVDSISSDEVDSIWNQIFDN